MAAPTYMRFKKIASHPTPRSTEAPTEDSLFWKSFEFPVTKKEYGPITDLHFSPLEPYKLAVASSNRVQMHSPGSNEPVQMFTKFKEQVHCARFRQDGQLVIAGSDSGFVRVFETEKRTTLRNLKNHKSAVYAVSFLSDGLRMVSCGADQRILLWDLASGVTTGEFLKHTDRVQCCSVNNSTKDIFTSGSYDHTAKLWDTRSGECIQNVNHGAPIEDVLMFPSGSMFLTAGGTSVRVWDSLAGGKLLLELNNHHKTVTSLAFCNAYQRLITASLDRHAKIYDVCSYQVVHTMDLPAPILSIGVSNDDGTMAIGMSDGMLSMRRRKPNSETKFEQNQKSKKVDGTLLKDAHVIKYIPRTKLDKYDTLMKNFDHSAALDEVIQKWSGRSPETVVGMFEELIRTSMIVPALAGRDDESLRAIVGFISKHVTNVAFSSILMDVANIILDIYFEYPERLVALKKKLSALKFVVAEELKYEEQLLQLLGAMDSIFATSNQTREEPVEMEMPTNDKGCDEAHTNGISPDASLVSR